MRDVVLVGDCLVRLKELPNNSVDSVVTDPPYELGFMGKQWDDSGIAYNKEMWAECLRVLKPGGYLLAFGGTRTYHRMASAIEDAGFEVRDMIEWVYGSGFPKSLNVAKMIEGKLVLGSANTTAFKHLKGEREKIINGYTKMEFEQGNKPANYNDTENGGSVTKPEFTTEEAKYWNGWGTALKPAHEPICMARKPLAEKTVAENCLKWGTGGINIDESRVKFEDTPNPATNPLYRYQNDYKQVTDNGQHEGVNVKFTNSLNPPSVLGRFPANLIHDGSEEVRECFPNESERFFKSIIYQAKASKSERNKGLEEKPKVFNGQSDKSSTDMKDVEKRFTTLPKANNHPTVKPIALMEYLIKMVTPKGGIVLDPFAGSGSTLVAAKQNGFKYIGIELTEEYLPIIEARLKGVYESCFERELCLEDDEE